MPRRILILVSVLAALVLLLGCEKDVLGPVVKKDLPVVEPISKVTVEIKVLNTGGSATPVGVQEVAQGSSLKITTFNEVGYKSSIKVNDLDVALIDNTYNLTNIDKFSKVDISFEKTLQWYILQNNWEKTIWQKRLVTAKEDDWVMTVVAPQLAFEKLVYHENNRFEMFNEKGVLYGDGNYFVKGDSIISGTDSNGNDGIRRKIIKVDDKILIVERLGKYHSAPYVRDPSKDEYVRETYVAKKK